MGDDTLTRRFERTALLLALATILALVWRLRLEKMAFAKARRDALMPRVGQWVPEVPSDSVAGELLTLGRAGRRQVLVFLQSECVYCSMSLPLWRDLADSVRKRGDRQVDFIGVQLDTLVAARQYVATHALPFPVVRFRSFRDSRVYLARATPYILVIDTSGRVSYAREGALTTRGGMDSVLTAAFPSRRPRDAVAGPAQ